MPAAAKRVWSSGLTLVACALSACAGMATRSLAMADHGSTIRLVSAVEIERTGARTAWDALRTTLPGLSLRENRSGIPVSIGRHGRSSIYLSSAPLVLVDFVQLSDIRMLRDIAARDVLSIELLNGIDATTYYGTNAGGGVVRIRTKGSAQTVTPDAVPPPPPAR